MKIKVKSTGEIKYAVYAATPTGNKRFNVDGKFYTDKQFNKLFEPVISPEDTGEDDSMKFKIHTFFFLKEIVDNALPQNMGVLFQPLNIFRSLLVEVGNEAARINDHKLNKLMIRLGIYSMACPDDKDYNPELVKRILSNDMTVYNNN